MRNHLRELRRRLGIGVLAVLAGTVVGWLIYPQAFESLGERAVRSKPMVTVSVGWLSS